jgi:hypothetical protein
VRRQRAGVLIAETALVKALRCQPYRSCSNRPKVRIWQSSSQLVHQAGLAWKSVLLLAMVREIGGLPHDQARGDRLPY